MRGGDSVVEKGKDGGILPEKGKGQAALPNLE